MKQYKVSKNPNDKKFYVLGYMGIGGGYWMPVSNSFDKKIDAEKWMRIQISKVDPDAKKVASGIE